MTARFPAVLLLLAPAACGAMPAQAAPLAPAEPQPAAAPADPAPPAPSDFASAMLAEHNRYRARHCAPPLTWSAEIAERAQHWADRLRDHGCGLEHSHGPYGENLAAATAGLLDTAAVVAMWYREIEAYDFKRGGFSMQTGHFTQVVWRGTARLGCARSTCGGADGADVWVCNYDPPGNYEGQFRDNVRPQGCKAAR
jgi:uncharacterized protein YkwD